MYIYCEIVLASHGYLVKDLTLLTLGSNLPSSPRSFEGHGQLMSHYLPPMNLLACSVPITLYNAYLTLSIAAFRDITAIGSLTVSL